MAITTTGCPRRAPQPPANAPEQAAQRAPHVSPDGASCTSRPDCGSGQVCVANVCRYRTTSAPGEVLATAADNAMSAGDTETAVRSYRDAIRAFDEAGAPVPGALYCTAANAALSVATTADQREATKRDIEGCLRGTLPGDANRQGIVRTLARLRHRGLEIARLGASANGAGVTLFRAAEGAPTIESVHVQVHLPQGPGLGETLHKIFAEDESTARIKRCFITELGQRPENRATARFRLTYNTNASTIGIAASTTAASGFDACVRTSLAEAVRANGFEEGRTDDGSSEGARVITLLVTASVL